MLEDTCRSIDRLQPDQSYHIRRSDEEKRPSDGTVALPGVFEGQRFQYTLSYSSEAMVTKCVVEDPATVSSAGIPIVSRKWRRVANWVVVVGYFRFSIIGSGENRSRALLML